MLVASLSQADPERTPQMYLPFDAPVISSRQEITQRSQIGAVIPPCKRPTLLGNARKAGMMGKLRLLRRCILDAFDGEKEPFPISHYP
jgi:hypothetical protein